MSAAAVGTVRWRTCKHLNEGRAKMERGALLFFGAVGRNHLCSGELLGAQKLDTIAHLDQQRAFSAACDFQARETEQPCGRSALCVDTFERINARPWDSGGQPEMGLHPAFLPHNRLTCANLRFRYATFSVTRITEQSTENQKFG